MSPVAPVLTVTLNPAIDLNLVVDDWHTGEYVKARAVHRAAGGKGINVSRVLSELGVASCAACLVGGADGEVFLSLLQGAPFDVVPIRLAGADGAADLSRATRTNVTFTSARRARQIKVNQPGPRVGRAAWPAIEQFLTRQAIGRRWVVLSGSLPPGVPAGAYSRLVRAAHRVGSRVALDCGGAPLRAALSARPDLIKPNLDELTEASGGPCRSVREIVAAARELLALGAGCVVVSRGGRSCLAVTPRGVLAGAPPPIRPRSPMGAGDSLVAGLVAALLKDPDNFDEALRLGIACGAACACEPDTVLARGPVIRRLLRRVRITMPRVEAS